MLPVPDHVQNSSGMPNAVRSDLHEGEAHSRLGVSELGRTPPALEHIQNLIGFLVRRMQRQREVDEEQAFISASPEPFTAMFSLGDIESA